MDQGEIVAKQPVLSQAAFSGNMAPLQMYPPPVNTVVVNQPTTFTTTTVITDFWHPRGIPRDWSTPLCGCFEDCVGCLCAFFCFSCYECHVSSKMGETCCTPFCMPNATMVMRAHFRGRHNIQGSLINDCCTSCHCAQCALAQISREVDNIKAGRAAP